MKLGVLFSGGKDSTLALHLAAEKEEVACLITVVSINKESYEAAVASQGADLLTTKMWWNK